MVYMKTKQTLITALLITLAIPASAKWIYDGSSCIVADGTGPTPAGTTLNAQTTFGTWGNGITANQIQLRNCKEVTAPFIDLTEPIELANGTPKRLESIAANCFDGNKNIETVLLPDTIKFLGAQSFNKCSNLKTIGQLPAELRAMGGGVFNECYSLCFELKLPESLTTTWNSFYKTQVYGDIVWPKKAGSVKIKDFAGTKITSFTIQEGSNCTALERTAFTGCTALTNVVLTEGIVTFGNYNNGEGSVFENCTALSLINIPNSLTNMGYNTFQNCTSLTGEFIWPEKVPFIPSNCFNGSGISSFIAKTGLKKIYTSAFRNCTNLKTIVLSDTLETIDDASYAVSLDGVTVYWRACPKNALTGGLYTDWGSGWNRTHYFSATPENIAAWQAYEALDTLNDPSKNYTTFILPEVFENGKPNYKSVGTAGQENGKIYWWRDPDLLPKGTIIMVY